MESKRWSDREDKTLVDTALKFINDEKNVEESWSFYKNSKKGRGTVKQAIGRLYRLRDLNLNKKPLNPSTTKMIHALNNLASMFYVVNEVQSNDKKANKNITTKSGNIALDWSESYGTTKQPSTLANHVKLQIQTEPINGTSKQTPSKDFVIPCRIPLFRWNGPTYKGELASKTPVEFRLEFLNFIEYKIKVQPTSNYHQERLQMREALKNQLNLF